MKKIGIVGSRRRTDQASYRLLKNRLMLILDPEDQLVSGGCPTGADSWAELLAKQLGLSITIHYPDWDRHGKSAGFTRNTKIAEDCDVLIAVVAEDRTGGTEDTIRKARKLNKPIWIIGKYAEGYFKSRKKLA